MNENTKSETRNSKQNPSYQTQNHKQYDLEGRCLNFARRINAYVNKLPKTIPNLENGRQLVRSGGSVGANYIEANESLSKRDFVMRVKISKKETKESRFWLMLTEPLEEEQKEKGSLIQESTELMNNRQLTQPVSVRFQAPLAQNPPHLVVEYIFLSVLH